MRPFLKTTLSVVLTVAPLSGLGCSSLPSRVTHARPLQHCESRLNAARVEENRGNLETAKRLYQEVRKIDPNNGEALHRLGVICTRLGHAQEADAYFRQALELTPNQPDILADMGYAAFTCKDYATSETHFQASLNLRDGDRRTLTNLAIVQAWQGKDDASLATFRRVNSAEEAMRNLAAIQIARGDRDRGMHNYELANAPQTQSTTTSVPAIPSTAHENVPSIALPSPESSDIPIPAEEPLYTVAPPPPGAVDGSSRDASLLAASFLNAAQVVPPPPTSCSSAFAPPLNAIPEPHLTPVEPEATPEVPPEPAAPKSNYDDSALKRSVPRVEDVPELDAAVETPLSPPEPETIIEPVVPPEEPLTIPQLPIAPPPREVKPKPTSAWRKSTSPGSFSGHKDAEQIERKEEVQISEPVNSNSWNVCLVTLFEDKRLVPGAEEFSIEHQSQSFHFSSVEAMEKFRADPQRYSPVAGGLDVVCVRNKRSVVQGSLNFALWYRQQLYLFSSAETANEFRREPDMYAGGN